MLAEVAHLRAARRHVPLRHRLTGTLPTPGVRNARCGHRQPGPGRPRQRLHCQRGGGFPGRHAAAGLDAGCATSLI